MTDPGLGAWLRREREQRGWTKAEMVRRMVKAGRDNGGNPSPESIQRRIHQWEVEGGVSSQNRLLYCRAFGIDPSQFGPHADGEPRELAIPHQPATPAMAAPAVFPAFQGVADPQLLAAAAMIYRGRQEPGLGEFAAAHEVPMAAHEGSDHTEEYEDGVGEATSEQLRADVVRLARETDSVSPMPVFRDLRRVRSRIYRLLDRRLWPREQTELHFLLGIVNGLMGVNAHMLGYPDAAEELIRAGYASAAGIDHNPLQAMLRLKLSYFMYERRRYSESRDLASDGLQYVSQGSLGAELHVWHAYAAAQLGDVDTARRSVGLGDDARESDYTDDVIDIGGEFAITPATHHALAGSALVNASGAERDAAAKLEQAISMYDEGPGEGEEFWFGGKPLAGINLAVVRLRSGALDAAVAALGPALALPAEQRISDITGRLADVRRELAAPIFQRSPQARDLGDQIEAFSSDTVTADLHSLTG